MSSAVAWGRLIVSLAATSRSLRDALLGPQASDLWKAEDFGGLYLSLAPRPRRWGRAGWDLAQRSQGLAGFLARQGIQARSAVARGGNWRPPDIADAHALLKGVDDLLQLVEMNGKHQAASINAAVLGSSVTRMTYLGDQHFTFPDGLQELLVTQRLRIIPRVPLFRSLHYLRQLRRLELDLPDWCMMSEDVHSLAEWYPHLQALSLRLHVATWTGYHAVYALTTLPPSVRTSLQLEVHICSGDRFLVLLQQLHGVVLFDLSISCSSSRLTPAAEEHLAQCTIRRRLTLHLQNNAARRLQSLPPGLEVVYGEMQYATFAKE